LCKCKRLTGPTSDIEVEIANRDELTSDMMRNLRNNCKLGTDVLKPTIIKFKSFCETNFVKVIEADKNAGICIVNKVDYHNEVLRQLDDLSIFHPSTYSQFELSMIEFKDRVKIFEKGLPDSLKLSRFNLTTDKPASFYILPKVHKVFDKFPKGRPISITFHKTNKYVSRLLDFVLKPCMNDVEDVLIDTQHFLLLLNNITLDKNKKYALVTIDVEALYPSLNITDCKKHCADTYINYSSRHNLDFKLNRKQFLELMSLSLDYNFVEYEGNMYYQHKGIEMGNAASVMVANITVFQELNKLFSEEECIAFYKRFLDDIFLLVDLENIVNLDEWLGNLLKHRYLKFTHEHSMNSINFLDVKVSISEDNSICTQLFVKPMSKHMYLHASSNHPTHLKESLFYSQGLRIVRICSEYQDRLSSLCSLYEKFVSRDYAHDNLHSNLVKLLGTNRHEALKPKKSLLCTYLSLHNPNIMVKYAMLNSNTHKPHTQDQSSLFCIFPFYKSVNRYKQILHETILSHVISKCTPEYKSYIESLCVKIVFSRTKNLKEDLKV